MNKPKDNWLSPYTIIEKLFFWREIEYQEPIVQKWKTVLDPFCDVLHTVRNFLFRDINYVKIDKWDTWSMDSTLSPIILPMLKQLKKEKQGCPWTSHEDGPWYYRFQLDEEDEHSLSDKEGSYSIGRWDWIMDEMIWTFEQLSKDSYDDQYWFDRGEINWNEPADERGLAPVTWKRKYRVDEEGLERHERMIKNGLRLFGKYYRNLWD